MQVKWDNIICLTLIITLIVLLVKLPLLLRTLSDDFGALRYGNGDPAVGLMALGLICTTVLAIFIVLSRRQ
jgi:predicted secreted protein